MRRLLGECRRSATISDWFCRANGIQSFPGR